MFNIRFYNEKGSITFCGGGNSYSWRLTAVDGLTFCGRTFRSARYSGQPGEEITSALLNSRTITLSGDFKADDRSDYSRALVTLEDEGILEVNTTLGKRNIKARCSDFAENGVMGKYRLFTVQFICENPYFEDADKTEVPIFKEIPLLDENFTFPGMFSRRISRDILLYSGEVETEPVFFINITEGGEGENELSITNHTGGESLKFNYGAALGDCITIDVEKRKIYNRDGVSLLEYLSDDSFFDGFHLYPGANDIEVINRNMNTGMTVTCLYSNKYLEAAAI